MLSERDARALRLKRADRLGDIANAQADIDAIDRELGDAPATAPEAPAEADSVLPGVQGPVVAWNWSNPWAPSEWSEPKLGGYPWKAGPANVRLDEDGQLHLSVTEKGSAQVQASDAVFTKEGKFAADVTMPQMKPGMVAAVWTYNKDTTDEIDFEVVGTKGLFVTVWTKVNGQHTAVWDNGGKAVLPGDLSGKRLLLEIDYKAGKTIVFTIDGKEVARATPAASKNNGAFPAGPMKPYLDLWVAEGTDAAWAGQWAPMGVADSRTMTVHGFRQT